MVYPAKFTEFFGPCMWKVMHSVAFTYPDNPSSEERKQYTDFFEILSNVIPCPGCGVHYSKYIENNPVRADSKEDLSRWVYDLHSDVNKRNNKTNPTFDEVKNNYTGFDEKSHEALNKLPQAEQTRRMADPHFGLLGEGEVVTDVDKNNKIMFAALLVVVALVVFVVYKRSKIKEDEIKK